MRKLVLLLVVFAFMACEKEDYRVMSNDKEYKVLTDSKTLVTYYAFGDMVDIIIYKDWSVIVNDNDSNYILRAMNFSSDSHLTISVKSKGVLTEKTTEGSYPSCNIQKN